MDTSYVGPEGGHVLSIIVDPPGGTNAVSGITLGLPTRAVLLRVAARLARELGKPARDVCSENSRLLIWTPSNGRTVVLRVRDIGPRSCLIFQS